MKIQCDVCEKDEASIFCVADEAALCAACDHRVHHANKLAGKHQRFSLHQPSPKQAPLCDVCQERKAFLFCQQDRAILCKECDIPIHKANEHTQKHTRFLLTGVKVSANSTLYSESPSASSNLNNSASIISTTCTTSTAKGTTVESPPESSEETNVQFVNGGINSNSASSISEYLTKTLPGWDLEDFLDSSSSSATPYGFSKNGENDFPQFWDADLESNMSVIPTEKMGFWVPQVLHQTQNQSMEMIFGTTNCGFMVEQSKELGNDNVKSGRKKNEDNSFAVPQITPPSNSSKRSRTFW